MADAFCSIRRVKQHKTNLNKILQDSRIHGSRRILAQLLAMWMDSAPEDKRVLTLVLIGTFGPRLSGIRWQEADEETIGAADANTKIDIDARKHLQNVLAEILEETDAVSTQNV